MSEDQLHRFARGELSAKESRELVQKGLDDPDLFEELTCTSLARTALTKRVRRWPVWLPLAGLAAAIVIALLSTSLFRRSLRMPSTDSIPVAAPPIAVAEMPVFLAHRVGTAPVFRSADSGSRAPRMTGSVTSIANRTVTIDLGSLDGLAKGTDAEVLRDGNVLGRIRLTTIFRESARAEMPPGLALSVNDSVRVPLPMYLQAALDQIAALSASGDQEGARRIARQAAAGDKVDIPVTSYEDWNNLGGIAEYRGDRAKAQSRYEQALRADPPQEARRIIEANLARARSAR